MRIKVNKPNFHLDVKNKKKDKNDETYSWLTISVKRCKKKKYAKIDLSKIMHRD